MSGFRLDVLAEYWPLFVEGAAMTIKLTVACVVCGVMLGMLLGMARMASARHDPWKSILYYGVRWPVTIWVSFFRGTPLFVQIFLMYFAVLPIFIHPVDGLIISGSLARELRGSYGALIAGFLAISLNAGAYMSEVFRAGIQSLDKGQSEAARSVGMSYWQCMRHIILPQAFKRIIPPLGNEFIAMLKDSSLVSVIGFEELTRSGQLIIAETYGSLEIWSAVAVIYLVMTLTITRLVSFLEKRFKTSDAR